MTKAQQKNEDILSENLRNQIAALAKSDFSLLPLCGPDGKTPAVRNWAKKRLNLSQVLGPMYGQGSTCYGIRLDKIVVLDCDEMDPDLIKTLEDRFGRAAVTVRTARGVHLYYRDTGSRPTLRSEGLPVDVKAGASAYVVGPLSQRPDGAYYEPMRGDLSETPLTSMSAPPVASVNAIPPAMVPSGNRHDHLLRKAREFVEAVETKAELLDNLCWERDENCASPAGISDTELGKIADWIWEKRLSNSLYAGRNSALKLSRCAMDALGNSAALALYARLFDLHGHLPGKVFSLNHPAMRKAGRTDLSRERFRTARRLLETQGFLRKVRPHSPRRHGIGYQLSQPFVASETNVAPLDGPKEADKGSIVTYVDGKPSRPIATLKQDNADD